MSPIISPKKSGGTTTSNFITGSKITGFAFFDASCRAIDPAILNAISEESTSGNEPSYRATAISTIGYPASIPLSIASFIPFPAAGKGIKEAMDKGILAGYPMVDMAVALYDGSFHEVDSSEMAFKIAGSIALQ